MHDAIDTDPLRLRPFISDDVQFAFDWFGDPLVMRFTPSGPDRSMGQTAEITQNIVTICVRCDRMSEPWFA